MTTTTTLLAETQGAAQLEEHPDAARDRVAAEKLYPSSIAKKPELEAPRTAAVQAIRAADAAVGAKPQYGQLEDSKGNPVGIVKDFALAVDPLASNENLKKQTPELARLATDMRFQDTDVTMLTSVIRQNNANPPTSAQVEANRAQIMSTLRQRHSLDGPGAFDRVIADTRTLAKRDPRLVAILNKNNVGDEPRVFLRIAELAKEAREKGEIK